MVDGGRDRDGKEPRQGHDGPHPGGGDQGVPADGQAARHDPVHLEEGEHDDVLQPDDTVDGAVGRAHSPAKVPFT